MLTAIVSPGAPFRLDLQRHARYTERRARSGTSSPLARDAKPAIIVTAAEPAIVTKPNPPASSPPPSPTPSAPSPSAHGWDDPTAFEKRIVNAVDGERRRDPATAAFEKRIVNLLARRDLPAAQDSIAVARTMSIKLPTDVLGEAAATFADAGCDRLVKRLVQQQPRSRDRRVMVDAIAKRRRLRATFDVLRKHRDRVWVRVARVLGTAIHGVLQRTAVAVPRLLAAAKLDHLHDGSPGVSDDELEFLIPFAGSAANDGA